MAADLAILGQLGCIACRLLSPYDPRGNLTDAFIFQGGACNMASSVAGCLRPVGYDVPRVCDVMPVLDVDHIVATLTAQLQDMSGGA